MLRSSRERLLIGLACSGAISACASAPEPVPDYTAGLRYGAECSDARARAGSGDSVQGRQPPEAMEMFVPPVPVPKAVRGQVALITIGVDSLGVPVPASIQVEGLADQRYAAKLAKLYARLRFRPAALDGCAVSGIFRLTVALR